jgi:uncharacterized protein YdeI (YjbR/CyaY-like superfamily)
MTHSMRDRYERVHAPDRQAFRAWLAEHHATSPGIWLVFNKKSSGKASISYNDAVEEALCFGWIDSTMNPIDDASYMQLFTPRKPKSGWARTNKERVERLIAQKLMMPAGFASIELAKKNGSWAALDSVEAMEMPADLKKALKANAGAQKGFESFSPSGQKQLLYWLNMAKREETRARRIAEIVAGALAGRNPRA